MNATTEPVGGEAHRLMPAAAEHPRVASAIAPPRRLTLVGPLPPPSGGMANQTRQLAKLLAADGVDVRVVQTNAPYAPSWIGRVPFVRAAFRLLPYLFRLWRDVRGADVAHVMANSGRWIVLSLRHADRVIVPSGFLRAVFERHGVSATIVPNVVDLGAFRPATEPPRTPQLAVTRNLEAIYDIATAIRAFAEVVRAHPEAHLTIAGSGPERAALERLADELGVRVSVHFTGRLDNAELPELYRASTLMLNPARIDNMPNALLEAMASGVPIVSTNVGGIPYMVEDGVSALLVAPGDAREMARAALRILGDPALGRRIAAAGLDAAQRHAWTSVRGDLFDAYARAAGRRAPTVRQA